MSIPIAWPAKDPHATYGYLYIIPLDAGDSVTSYVFELMSGTVVIESATRDGANVTAVLSGGVDGETSVFRISWETTNGAADDDVVLLPIVAHELTELLFTGYAKPSFAHLIAKYPAFAAVPPVTVKMWLKDAERTVDTSWIEGDYAAALMALAAHNMAAGGLGTGAASTAGVPSGITSMRSADLSLTFSDKAANNRVTGSLASTIYGAEFAIMLRRNKAGPRVTPTGVSPSDGYIYPMGAW